MVATQPPGSRRRRAPPRSRPLPPRAGGASCATSRSARTRSRSAASRPRAGAGCCSATRTSPGSARERFYQFQLTLPGKLNVQGASLHGIPVINIGFNDQRRLVAHGVDRMALHPVPAPARGRQPEGLRLRRQDRGDDAAGPCASGRASRAAGLETRSHTFWYSRFGPIVNIPPPATPGTRPTPTRSAMPTPRTCGSSTSGSTWTVPARSATSSGPSRATRACRGSTRSPPTRAAGRSTRTTASCPPSTAPEDRHLHPGRPAAGRLPGRRRDDARRHAARVRLGAASAAPSSPASSRPGTCRSSSGATTSRTPTTRTGTRTRSARSPASRRSSAPRAPSSACAPATGCGRSRTGWRARTACPAASTRSAGCGTLWQRDDSEAGRLLADQLAALCEANPTVDGRRAGSRRARRLPGLPQLGRDRAAGQQGRLAVRRLVASYPGARSPTRSTHAAADHAEPARHRAPTTSPRSARR